MKQRHNISLIKKVVKIKEKVVVYERDVGALDSSVFFHLSLSNGIKLAG